MYQRMQSSTRLRRVGGWAAALLFGVGSLAAADSQLPLIEAVQQKADAAAVEALLLQPQVDVNAPDVDGTTALHWAAHLEDIATAEALIRVGADVNAKNRYGVTPLALACINGDAAMIEALLKSGSDPNTALPEGETALMTAARTGNAAAVEVLLAHGAAVQATESWSGQNALMWAAGEGHLPVAHVLIEQGADVNARSTQGYTPLMFAARQGHAELVELLLARGANVNDTQSEGAGSLLMAIHNGHFELAARLLGKGADPNTSASGYTPLHLLLQVRRPDLNRFAHTVATGELDSLDLIKALLAHGADPNARMAKPFLRLGPPQDMPLIGATPFFLAAKGADVPVMRLLLASGVNEPLLPTEATNATPLMAAAGVGYQQGYSPGSESEALEAVTLALELGADVNAADKLGLTALHGAAIRGANSIVRFLVANGARLDVRDKRGRTALTIAEEGAGDSSQRRQLHTAALLRELMANTR